MTVVPLPASPCVRVKLDYHGSGTQEMGSRFYLSYSGSAPSGANCVTLATDVSNAWAAHMAGEVANFYSLIEVDVLDIATHSGLSGQYSLERDGSGGTVLVPTNCAVNVEFGIARRYRGGKPRMFFPPASGDQLSSDTQWSSSYISGFTTAVQAFFAAVVASSVGSMGTLAHVNLSYYKGFTNITNSSGRERAVPTYRDTALVDPITGYFPKALVGSQRRRRTSTTF